MELPRISADQAESVLKDVLAHMIKAVDTLNTQVIHIQGNTTDQGYQDASKDQIVFAVYNLLKEALHPALDMALHLHPEWKDFIEALIKQREEMKKIKEAQAEQRNVEQSQVQEQAAQ